MSFAWPRVRHRARVLAGSLALVALAASCSSNSSNTSTGSPQPSSEASSPSYDSGAAPTTDGSSTGDTVAATSTTVPEPSTTLAAPPEAPTGAFLNSHTLSISGGGAPRDAVSVCKTSPGATCAIRFSNDTDQRLLGPTTADADGIVTWTWTPSQIGLTAGHWKVDVVAARGGHEATASDPMGLQVVP